MKLKELLGLVMLALLIGLIGSCAKEQHEPLPGVKQQEYDEEQITLTDLYKSVRASTAKAMRQVSNEVELRSLSGQAQTSAPIAISHGYAAEMESENFSSGYKEACKQIMGSLTYEDNLPSVEEILSLPVVDTEKARLITALALVSEVHTAIGAGTFALPKDSLLLPEALYYDGEDADPTQMRKRRRFRDQMIEQLKDDWNDCLEVRRVALQDAAVDANNAFWDTVHSRAKDSALAGAFLGTRASWKGMLVGGVFGYLSGGAIGLMMAPEAEQLTLARLTERAERDYRNCVDGAKRRVFREIERYYDCTGRMVIEEPPVFSAYVQPEKEHIAVGESSAPPISVTDPTKGSN